MTERISASELRLRVGQVIARIQYAGARFLVERRGRAVAAVVSVEDLAQLEQRAQPSPYTREERLCALALADAVRELIAARRTGKPLPDSTALLRELREERDNELARLR